MCSLKYLQTLGELNSAILLRKNHETIFDSILTPLCEFFEIRSAALFLPTGGHLRIAAAYCIDGCNLLQPTHQTTHIINEVAETAETYTSQDCNTEFYLYIPIIADNNVAAVLAADKLSAADTQAFCIMAENIIKSALTRKYELEKTAALVKENKKLRVILEGGNNSDNQRNTRHISSTPKLSTLNELTDAYEKKIINYALQHSKGNMSAAARLLGLSPRVMHYKINRLGIGVVKK